MDEWHDYYEERMINPETGKSHYTHRRLRSALRSLMTNFPTYLPIKNTLIWLSPIPQI